MPVCARMLWVAGSALSLTSAVPNSDTIVLAHISGAPVHAFPLGIYRGVELLVTGCECHLIAKHHSHQQAVLIRGFSGTWDCPDVFICASGMAVKCFFSVLFMHLPEK